jgi:hypothetical protein
VLDTGYEPAPGWPNPHEGELGAWYLKICGDAANPDDLVTSVIFGDVELVWIPAASAPVAAGVSPATLAAQARRFLPLPAPTVRWNPAPNAFVRVPTWFWIDAASWGSRTSTVAVPGLSVTVTATPETSTWNPGDGSGPVVCAGPGTPYVSGHEVRGVRPSCAHTYLRSSAGAADERYVASATTTWQVRWRSSTGAAGVLPPFRRTTTWRIRVAEVRTVVVDSH